MESTSANATKRLKLLYEAGRLGIVPPRFAAGKRHGRDMAGLLPFAKNTLGSRKGTRENNARTDPGCMFQTRSQDSRSLRVNEKP